MKNDQNEKQQLSELDFFSSISKNDLRGLGVGNVAYLKRYTIEGKRVFVLHAADGAALEVQKTESVLKESAQYQDLNLVTVH